MIDENTKKITATHHRKLFERYLQHVIEYDKSHHALWAQINAVYEASSGMFIDAQALTLTVAIESLLASEFSDLSKPSDSDIQAIKEAQAYFQAWTGRQDIKDRINGSMGQLKQARAGDKMRALVRVGAITEEQSKAWQKLRNASTHSYQTNSLSSDEFRKLLSQVEVLFYHLIFYTIGYRGPYVDFSSPGWPLKHYPANS